MSEEYHYPGPSEDSEKLFSMKSDVETNNSNSEVTAEEVIRPDVTQILTTAENMRNALRMRKRNQAPKFKEDDLRIAETVDVKDIDKLIGELGTKIASFDQESIKLTETIELLQGEGRELMAKKAREAEKVRNRQYYNDTKALKDLLFLKDFVQNKSNKTI